MWRSKHPSDSLGSMYVRAMVKAHGKMASEREQKTLQMNLPTKLITFYSLVQSTLTPSILVPFHRLIPYLDKKMSIIPARQHQPTLKYIQRTRVSNQYLHGQLPTSCNQWLFFFTPASKWITWVTNGTAYRVFANEGYCLEVLERGCRGMVEL